MWECQLCWGNLGWKQLLDDAISLLPLYPGQKTNMYIITTLDGCWHSFLWLHPAWALFTVWCWGRLLRVPWTPRRSNQSILKKTNPEYSLEVLMLKLKDPILWRPDAKSQLIGKDPDAGKDWGQEEKRVTEDEIASPIQWTWTQANSERQWGRGKPGMLQSKGLQRVRHNLANEQLKQCLQGNPFVSQQLPTFQVTVKRGLSHQEDLVSPLFTAIYPLWF